MILQMVTYSLAWVAFVYIVNPEPSDWHVLIAVVLYFVCAGIDGLIDKASNQ